MKFFTSLGVSLLAAAAAVQASALPADSPLLEKRDICSKPTGSCNFYNSCLESKYKCGSNGYPLNYGKKYCEAFTDNRSKFSEDKGRPWVTKTMKCLQNKLVTEATSKTKATCSDINTKAFGSHASCYIDSGMCGLYLQDWIQILKTVDVRDMFGSPQAFAEVLKTTAGCASLYKWMLDNKFLTAVKNAWNWVKGSWEAIVDLL